MRAAVEVYYSAAGLLFEVVLPLFERLPVGCEGTDFPPADGRVFAVVGGGQKAPCEPLHVKSCSCRGNCADAFDLDERFFLTFESLGVIWSEVIGVNRLVIEDLLELLGELFNCGFHDGLLCWMVTPK